MAFAYLMGLFIVSLGRWQRDTKHSSKQLSSIERNKRIEITLSRYGLVKANGYEDQNESNAKSP